MAVWMQHTGEGDGPVKRLPCCPVFPFLRFVAAVIPAMLILVFSANPAQADEALSLKSLIAEALKNNREIQAAEARWKASTYRVRQAESLPDPMVMVGYQNDGWDNYTFGKMEGAMWMYSVSQMFPFPGKRSLKGDMAGRDAESLDASYETVRLRTIAAVKELYYELFLAYKTLDLVRDRTSLFSRIEDAAVARYSAGMAPQQELLMAQTEKYMLLERETMLRQKILSLEAMLNNAAGRETNAPPGRPPESAPSEFALPLDDALTTAYRNSPEIRSKERMIASSRARIGMAEKEYFPDFTLAASVFKRSGEFEDMWSLTATVNVPLYFNTKRHAVYEAKALSYEAQSELEATKLMLTSSLRDNYSMLGAADRLMGLYKDGLIPKTYQDFDSALSGYVSGKVEAITVISRLKALLDFETLYWGQFVEREKAIARIEALAGIVSH